MKLKITAIGNSAGIILPKELLARLRVGKGDELFAIETPDGVRLTAFDPQLAAQMEVAEEVMRERRTLLPVRDEDIAYRLEGQALVGLLASTEHITVATVSVPPGGAVPAHAHRGDVYGMAHTAANSDVTVRTAPTRRRVHLARAATASAIPRKYSSHVGTRWSLCSSMGRS